MALTKRELIEFLNELAELVEVTHKEKANEIAQKILNEYEQQFGFEEEVVQETSLIYVGSLPEEVQKQIKLEVVSKLRELGLYSPENVERAMESKLSDLEDIIDTKKYEEISRSKKESHQKNEQERGGDR
ncbi:MAG: hypothetical protein ACK5ML_10365 [Lachnospiraceae bacterium]